MPELQVTWRSFELRPDPVPLLDPQGDYLTTVWRDHVYPMASRMGMPLKLPPLQPRTRLAHEAAKWAGDQGRFAKYNLALFRAFFEFGKDIGDVEILLKIAQDLDLDRQSLRIALDDRMYEAQIATDQEDSARAGVRAIPAFVAKGQLLAAGVQSANRLQELIKRVG